MPMIDPPALPLGRPVVDRIPAGTLLWRVHSKKYLANQRNPTPAPTVPGGGRFDSLAGSYSYSYFGHSEEGALAEAVFRDLPLDGTGPRQSRFHALRRRSIGLLVSRP